MSTHVSRCSRQHSPRRTLTDAASYDVSAVHQHPATSAQQSHQNNSLHIGAKLDFDIACASDFESISSDDINNSISNSAHHGTNSVDSGSDNDSSQLSSVVSYCNMSQASSYSMQEVNYNTVMIDTSSHLDVITEACLIEYLVSTEKHQNHQT